MEIAHRLPDRIGTSLLDAANAAFIEGIHVSAVISAIGAIGLAAFTWMLLRPVGIGAQPVVDLDAERRASGPSEVA